MYHSIKSVIGLGFGDEGKGLTTSYLCSLMQDKTLVVRFNGGHQAGHTVVHEGNRHVFSSFGSGTMQGVPTYLSRFCTFYPKAVLNEYPLLAKYKPILYVDPMCPVTTPYDVIYNKRHAHHGSCGVGFGATLRRHEDMHRKLFVRDLFYPQILIAKLNNIRKFYQTEGVFGYEDTWDEFLKEVEQVKDLIYAAKPYLGDFDLIFEGAQGLLLDQDFGFFPNVTRSNTGSKNINTICAENNLNKAPFYMNRETYYVTRSYQTRHGNGFMSDNSELSLKNAEEETNVRNEFQGEFRKGHLDLELLNYAIACDNDDAGWFARNLVITCLDQTGSTFLYKNGDNSFKSGRPVDLVNDLKAPIKQTYGGFGSSYHSVMTLNVNNTANYNPISDELRKRDHV